MIKIAKSLACIFIILLSSVSLLKAEEILDSLDNTKVIELTEDWLYYDHKFESYFPYTNYEVKVNTISQLIDLDKFKPYNLNFTATPGLTLFVNEKLFYKNNGKEIQNVRLKIEEINYLQNGDKELITFHHPKGDLPLELFFIGHSVSPSLHTNLLSQSIQMIPRDIASRQEVFIISFLLILVILAILRNRYPKKFYEFSHFNNIIPSMDEDVIYDLSSVPVLLFVLINSLCSSLILFLIYDQFKLYTLDFLNIFYDRPVLGILLVSIGFFFIFIIKYIYLKIAGWIFNLSEMVKVQFFELMKVSFKINLFLAVLTIIFYCSSYFQVQLNYDYFFYFTIISLLIVLMRVGYLAFKLSGFRNIYLFSYLCTTEILPLVIIIKLILF